MGETEWENVAGTYRRHEKEEDEQTEIQVSELNVDGRFDNGQSVNTHIFLRFHTKISELITYILYFKRMLRKSLKMQKECLHYPYF